MVFPTIKHNFYVDDWLKYMASVSQVIKLTKHLRKACSRGGFTPSKWIYNSQEVLTTCPDSHRAKVKKQLNLDKYKLLPSAKLPARKIINSCVFSRCLQPRVGEQKIADLPKHHTTPDLPRFSHVSIDYFGPKKVERG